MRRRERLRTRAPAMIEPVKRGAHRLLSHLFLYQTAGHEVGEGDRSRGGVIHRPKDFLHLMQSHKKYAYTTMISDREIRPSMGRLQRRSISRHETGRGSGVACHVPWKDER